MKLPRYLLKYILAGVGLLLLFHFETLYLGDLKISHIWKGILLIYLSIIVFVRKRSIDYLIYRPLILLSILQLFNYDIVNDPFAAFINFLTLLIIPVIGIYLLNFESAKLKELIIFFSSFFILSFLPYQFGFLESIESGYSLESFGGSIGLIGPYQNPHGASISLAISLIVILYYLFEGSVNRIYLSILFILGFYFLISTYVRTGLAMFLFGSLPILFHFGRKSIRTIIKVLVVGIMIVVLGGNLIWNNKVLMNRLKDQNKYNSEDTFEKKGSGRIGFWIASVKIFKESDATEKILGIGQTEKFKRMNQKIGLKVGSHNAFLDLLISNGIIGLLIFLLYLFNVYRFIQNSESDYNILIFALFFSYLIMSFVQGYTWLNANLILMISLGLKYNTPVCADYDD